MALRRYVTPTSSSGFRTGAAPCGHTHATAGSVMFLLGLGELLEEWTHKKSVDDLARSMSLNIDRVWRKTEEGECVLSVTA